jgi:hypothetical protein
MVGVCPQRRASIKTSASQEASKTMNRVAKILDFFRAGYPEGIPKTDHFAALAALNAIAGNAK